MTAVSHRSLLLHPEFPALSDHVIGETGLCYYRDHLDLLAACLADRIGKRGLSGCGAYLELLRDTQVTNSELDSLVELLTIGETHFFRHLELFEALKTTVFPEIIRRNAEVRRIRIWSAGCSIGAEAYSLSILLRRDLGCLLQGWDISILGTDINRKFLARAARGSFEEWALRGLPEELWRDCFRQVAEEWQIDPRYQQGVSFQYHNLARHPFPSLVHNLFAFDLILCRNVLIYFGPEVARRVADQAYNSLADGGWLAVGHADYNIELFRQFETVTAQVPLYRRREQSVRLETDVADEQPLRLKRFDASAAGMPTGTLFPCLLAVDQRLSPRANIEPHKTLSTSKKETPAPALSHHAELADIQQFADRGEISGALKLCQQVLDAHPMDPVCHFYYALLLDQAAPHELAEGALRRAIYLDRDFALAHYYLGLVQIKQERKADAVRSFRNVVKLLAVHQPDELVHNSDGLTVAELHEMAQMYIETMNE
jgi:chemotaxis protein methyltransferase CheR